MRHHRVLRARLFIAFGCALFLAPGFIYAQSADVTYVEGSVDLQPSGQDRTEAMIGDSLNPGDSIITGSDGIADLQKQDQSQITVSPGTVFTIRQISQGGQKRDVLALALGSISFKFNQVVGTEPLISTASAAAGIRGTELTVYAGSDGSSLFVVKSGKVDVTSAGQTVDLTQSEGVQVSPGQAPGAKFKVLAGFENFSSWNAGKVKAMLDDPVAAAERVEQQMSYYEKEIAVLEPEYAKNTEALTAARAKLKDVQQTQGKDAGQGYYTQNVFPLEKQGVGLFLNIRYYALSALSLKRFVLGRMYLDLTTRYITDPGNAMYTQFLNTYNRVVTTFDATVVPHLVAADI